jgi:uncharacterized protein YaiL (DUF2058 family)
MLAGNKRVWMLKSTRAICMWRPAARRQLLINGAYAIYTIWSINTRWLVVIISVLYRIAQYSKIAALVKNALSSCREHFGMV